MPESPVQVELSYQLPNETEAAASFTRSMLDRMEALRLGDESARFRVGVALDEALSNAMHHGNLEVCSSLRCEDAEAYLRAISLRLRDPAYADRRVHVEARFDAHRVAFVVRDEGPGFDPMTVPDPRLPENLQRAHGRGLMLIHSFMDEVRFNAKGNEICMAAELSMAPVQTA